MLNKCDICGLDFNEKDCPRCLADKVRQDNYQSKQKKPTNIYIYWAHPARNCGRN